MKSDFLQRDRVRRQTPVSVQAQIDAQTRSNIRTHAQPSRKALNSRIGALDRERDMEQVLEMNAGLIAFTGALLGTTVNRRFFLITGVVLGFLTQHAITGWCPPVPLFRRLGVRTRSEINQEKYALKALRGDFRAVGAADEPEAPEEAFAAVIA